MAEVRRMKIDPKKLNSAKVEIDNEGGIDALINELAENRSLSFRECFLDESLLEEIDKFRAKKIDWETITEFYSKKFGEDIKLETFRVYFSWGKRMTGYKGLNSKNKATSGSRKKATSKGDTVDTKKNTTVKEVESSSVPDNTEKTSKEQEKIETVSKPVSKPVVPAVVSVPKVEPKKIVVDASKAVNSQKANPLASMEDEL